MEAAKIMSQNYSLHAVMPNTKLQEHTGSEKAWVWSAVDFADEVQKPELFCIRFASVESELSMDSLSAFPFKVQTRSQSFKPIHQDESSTKD